MANDSIDGVSEEFDDIEDLTLFGELQLGEDARLFTDSITGQFMIGAIKQDIQHALEKLADTSDTFFGRRKTKRLKNEIYIKKQFLVMLNEAFTTGELAHQTLLNKTRG